MRPISCLIQTAAKSPLLASPPKKNPKTKQTEKPQRYSGTTLAPYPDFHRSSSVNCKPDYSQDKMHIPDKPPCYLSFALLLTINCTCFLVFLACVSLGLYFSCKHFGARCDFVY